ncbi:hypothetical protein [Polluticaenibacter yanchengensis]|uniref:Transposase n=1 Tax=Polluticaenibacter yanchengensis TaxID=3014562 RepID=A0ABT4UKU6_9BACT|nr:hypothetical protein [Chitinophagaceae bacterium LY-5]
MSYPLWKSLRFMAFKPGFSVIDCFEGWMTQFTSKCQCVNLWFTRHHVSLWQHPDIWMLLFV